MMERRKFPRADKLVRVVVRARVPAGDGSEAGTRVCAGTTRDVSVGGTRFQTVQHIVLGAPVIVTLAWDDPPAAFEMGGRVVRVRKGDTGPYEIGVAFTAENNERWRAWVAFCETSLPVPKGTDSVPRFGGGATTNPPNGSRAP